MTIRLRNLARTGLALSLAASRPTLGQAQGPLTRLDTLAVSSAALELSWVGDIAVDSRGNTYVADGPTHSVLVLAPDLSLQRRVGRHGAGPGEFVNVSSVNLLGDDSLQTYDSQLARITVFAPTTFAPVRTISLTADGGGHPLAVRARAGPLWLGLFQQPFVAGRPAESDRLRLTTIRAYTPTGAARALSFTTTRGPDAMVVRDGDRVMAGTRPFPGGCSVLLAGGAIFVVDRDSGLVDVRRADGALLTRLALPAQHPAIDPGERRDSIADTPEAFHALLEKEVPHRWPAVAGVAMDAHGSVWVGLRQAKADWVMWREVLPDGRLSPRALSLPRAFDLRYVSAARLLVLSYDEDDVPRILALAIHPNS